MAQIIKNAKKALEVAVYQEALGVQKTSMNLTPVLTGALRGSHETHRPEYGPDGLVVRVTVGGPAAPYALYVHENLDARHENGQAKFLEYAVLAHQPDFVANVAKRLSAAWGNL